MQFEEFDKKVKEAADYHHPAYDEQAWRKMENLLNKHMPQEKDDRRRFLFILLLFLVLGGSGLLIAKSWKSRKISTVAEQTVQKKQTANNSSTFETDKDDLKKEVTKTTQKNITNSFIAKENNKPDLTTVIRKPATGLPEILNKNKSNRITGTQLSASNVKTKPALANTNYKQAQVNDSRNKPANKREEETITINKTNLVKEVVKNDKEQDEKVVDNNPNILNEPQPTFNELAKTSDNKNEILPPKQTKEKKGINKSKTQKSFFLSLSAGPDVSFVSNNKLGTARILGGAGIGYTFNNRFTVRTGFYSGRKIYTASPDAYHPPDIFYVYYPYLEKVDADCKVYEIPISISYHFSKSVDRSFFASAGISSYLMKSEKYNYTYKYYPTGPTVNKEWSIKNQHKHYFSGITLSGGYQQNLNKHITFVIEPYVKLPLSGIGYGKVKLNSGGVLFTASIKPFR